MSARTGKPAAPEAGKTTRRAHCPYCGRRITPDRRACALHNDLPDVDPIPIPPMSLRA